MLISTTNDYALRMCAYLARQGGIASSKEIADAVGVSREYLIQIAQRLRNAGIVEARPGKHGGYRLAKEPGDVSALYDGWDLSSLLACLKERTDGVVALCRVVLDYEDAGEDARELAEEVLRELDGGDAS